MKRKNVNRRAKPITAISNLFTITEDVERVDIGKLFFCLRCNGVGLFNSKINLTERNLPFINQRTAKKDLIKYKPTYNSFFTHKCTMIHYPLLKHKK